jgi:glucosamine-phosphate N-acetyltransferase
MNNLSDLNLLLEKYNKEGEYIFRPLEITDYEKNYFGLLSQLTVAPTPKRENWIERFELINSTKLTKIYVCQFKDLIIATITCSVEFKFIRNLGSICHIEDFVIDEGHRKTGLGSKLLNLAKLYAKEVGCYKILLSCKDEVKMFYEKNGFQKTSNGMTIYLEN